MAEVLTYAQGQVATFTAQFVTVSGMAIDVPDATIAIYGTSSEVILAPTPMTNVITGFYFYDYTIPGSLPILTYTVRISGTVLGVPSATVQYLTVVQAGTPTDASLTQKQSSFVAALEVYLGQAQRIPVMHELARRNKAGDVFQLSWPRWNLSNVDIKVNEQSVVDGYSVDFDTGTVTFDTPLHKSDKVHAWYNFRWFTQTDELRFLNDALGQINLEPGGTGIAYTLENMPLSYVGLLMLGAQKNAYKRLVFDLQYQQPQTVFGGREGAKDAASNFMALKENSEKEFERDKKQIKKAVYPRMYMVVQPEFTLPGGKSRWFRYLFSSGGT